MKLKGFLDCFFVRTGFQSKPIAAIDIPGDLFPAANSILFTTSAAGLSTMLCGTISRFVLLTAAFALIGQLDAQNTLAQEPAKRSKQLLLLAQGPDGHPVGTHEYVLGQKRLAELLKPIDGLEIKIEMAEAAWPEKSDALDGADGVVLFLSEGAKWLSAEPRRLEIFHKFAARGGGLTVIHWGMGTRKAEPIPPFVALFGACHGGEDRKYKFVKTSIRPVSETHPITQGLGELQIYDEFYYRLKEVRDEANKDKQLITPLIEAKIDDKWELIGWCWERPDEGRSFGFSALHVHTNWDEPAYQRLMTQGVLWTLKMTPPSNWMEPMK